MSASPALEEPIPLNIIIASYGETGKASAEILKQELYLSSENKKTCRVTWIDLDLAEQQQTVESVIAEADIVVIMGDNTFGVHAITAVHMATRCAEKRIPCYALLCLPAGTEKPDPLFISLKNLASNTLLVSQDTATKTLLPKYLASAVLNLLYPITGIGLICVDFADIRTILSCGKKSLFTLAEKSGEHRANLAAQAALAQLSEVSSAQSMLCNITSGYDIRMEEIALIGDLVRDATPDDCLVVCTSTLISDCEEGWIQVGITVCLSEKEQVNP